MGMGATGVWPSTFQPFPACVLSAMVKPKDSAEPPVTTLPAGHSITRLTKVGSPVVQLCVVLTTNVLSETPDPADPGP